MVSRYIGVVCVTGLVTFITIYKTLCYAFYTGHMEMPAEGVPENELKVGIKYF